MNTLLHFLLAFIGIRLISLYISLLIYYYLFSVGVLNFSLNSCCFNFSVQCALAWIYPCLFSPSLKVFKSNNGFYWHHLLFLFWPYSIITSFTFHDIPSRKDHITQLTGRQTLAQNMKHLCPIWKESHSNDYHILTMIWHILKSMRS